MGIKRVYQTFVDLDSEDYGFVTYEAFCMVLRRAESPAMRKAFDAFDYERIGELDLRQFVVSLSMFTLSPTGDKLKFAFMMYDEDQEGAASKAEVLELLKAMAPHVTERDRVKHASKMYSMHNLHSGMRITIDEFVEYMLKDDYAKELLPLMSSSEGSSQDNNQTNSKEPQESGTPSSWTHSPSSSVTGSRTATREAGGSRTGTKMDSEQRSSTNEGKERSKSKRDDGSSAEEGRSKSKRDGGTPEGKKRGSSFDEKDGGKSPSGSKSKRGSTPEPGSPSERSKSKRDQSERSQSPKDGSKRPSKPG